MDFDIGAVVFGFTSTMFLGYILGMGRMNEITILENTLNVKNTKIEELEDEIDTLKSQMARIRTILDDDDMLSVFSSTDDE
jgi:hypothetical protein